jgi:hypothetical protein
MRLFTLLLLAPYLLPTMAQVNGYARVSSLSGATLTVAQSNETGATFDVGDAIVLMQMQDDVIGSTANDATFGSLGSIQQAGRYEILRIASLTRTAGVLSELVLEAPPTFEANTGGNARLQAITFERLGGGSDHTTTADITALDWNGHIGGVVAVYVQGELTLAHSISADGNGFRGGSADANNSGSCDITTFRAANTDQFAEKGEGIYRNTDANWNEARGRILNGGGGGNEHNGGGGGGGNYTAGGDAGPGWSCGSNSAGGLGGLALSGYIGDDRVFMGGGGGGGEGNNNVGTNGRRGGGIVLLKADSIITQGTCSGLRISANGLNAGQAGNDGAGGGGAGGSVVIQANGFRVASTCALQITANGGNGGRVNDGSTHGGGGGGGQGVVIFSSALPTGNITVNTLNGSGGCNNNSAPCNSVAQSGAGSNNSGIMTGTSGPLPVELVSFQAIPVNHEVDVTWITATELNSAYFEVQRSPDGEHWTALDRLPAAGFSHTPLHYRTHDAAPLGGTSYYRLRQVDIDGTQALSAMVPVRFHAGVQQLHAWPNPANERITVRHDPNWERPTLTLVDNMGRVLRTDVSYSTGQLSFDVRGIATGTYTALLGSGTAVARVQVSVQH